MRITTWDNPIEQTISLKFNVTLFYKIKKALHKFDNLVHFDVIVRDYKHEKWCATHVQKNPFTGKPMEMERCKSKHYKGLLWGSHFVGGNYPALRFVFNKNSI